MSIAAKGVAVVTGAAQGIGRAIALRLARDGYDLSVNDLQSNKGNLKSVADEISSMGRKSFPFFGDVSKENDVKDLVSNTVKELGSLDVMVANAGIEHWQPLIEMDTSRFEKTFAVNVKGVMFSYKYAALQMIKQGGGGRIIGAASLASKQGYKYIPAYSASKFAVRGLTQTAALELGEHGITVNAYAPGLIDTSMFTSLDKYMSKLAGEIPGHYIKNSTANTPLLRLGTPDDIAAVVSFLSSKDASFITGQTISTNGGLFFD